MLTPASFRRSKAYSQGIMTGAASPWSIMDRREGAFRIIHPFVIRTSGEDKKRALPEAGFGRVGSNQEGISGVGPWKISRSWRQPPGLPEICHHHWRHGRLLPHASLYARSEEHTSELQSLMRISVAVF